MALPVIPVYLKNGDQVKVNGTHTQFPLPPSPISHRTSIFSDHVYCSPLWAVRDGTPYSVARIMEFLPPEDAPKGPEGQLCYYSRVRLAWYYRPSDVSDRPVTDSRVLLAAIYSEVCDINQLRGKCFVLHRDKISDLSSWKKRPDRFYFNRLFDPYIKKEFDIIQSIDCRNLPDNIRDTLIERYEYVVAEKEMIPELTDVLRLCDSCQVWCPSPDSVQCDRCKRFFHMACVQPPLAAKPSRGYGWTCGPCSKQHEEQVGNLGANNGVQQFPRKSNAPAMRGRGRPRKDRLQAEKEEKLDIKHFRMWPFRYFGQHTVAEDTLDPEDLIFCRTAVRLGPKFQAVVSAEPEGDAELSEQEVRGGDNTVEVLSAINLLTDAEIAELESCKDRLTENKNLRISVDWLTEVIHRFSLAALTVRPFSTVNMKSPMRLEKWKRTETRYTDKPWSLEEVAAFEDGLAVHGPELRAIREEVPTRSIYEVVRFYGHWKCAAEPDLELVVELGSGIVYFVYLFPGLAAPPLTVAFTPSFERSEPTTTDTLHSHRAVNSTNPAPFFSKSTLAALLKRLMLQPIRIRIQRVGACEKAFALTGDPIPTSGFRVDIRRRRACRVVIRAVLADLVVCSTLARGTGVGADLTWPTSLGELRVDWNKASGFTLTLLAFVLHHQAPSIVHPKFTLSPALVLLLLYYQPFFVVSFPPVVPPMALPVIPVYLKNGDQVKVNDHVYCSPLWAVRDGTPYSVARIMEFLPPEDAPKGPEGQLCYYSRVRLAWYYRPSDVSDRPVTDSRVLLAAIYSEVCDINQLRGKCFVLHRDKISDLSSWKKRPDRFYFNRLFDPYIKKEFDIIQSIDCRNLPDNIRDTLIERYEYVVAEKEMIPELTDVLRLCDSCQVWCPSPDSVQCDRCKRFFHMACVQPPLAAKPSRGYGWTCGPCSKQHEEQVGNLGANNGVQQFPPRKSNAPAMRGRGRPRKDRLQAEKEEKLDIKHFRMWPFRYFGQHTVAEDTLDPEDLIFCRTAVRLGPKFQAVVSAEPEGDAELSEQEVRGGDNTVEVLSAINLLTDAEIAELESCKDRLTENKNLRISVDWLTEVIHRFSLAALTVRPFSTVNMKSPMRLEKWKRTETRYTDKPWSLEEVAAFEDGLAVHGPELRAIREEVPTRSIYEVVRFYGHWKCARLGEENLRILEHGKPAKSLVKQYRSIEEAAAGQRVGPTDNEGSVVSHPTKTPTCGACRTRDSKTWYKAPKGLSTSVLCETCGTNWRKYADLNVRPVVREESVPLGMPPVVTAAGAGASASAPPVRKAEKASSVEKREGTPLTGPVAKRARTSTSAQSTPPPPASTVPQLRCMACHKNGPLGKVLQCKQCSFRVHAGVCGVVVDPKSIDSWVCDICRNEELQEAALNTECLLCPRESKGVLKPAHPPAPPPPDSYLHARKPTEGQGWTHVLCSVFMNELTFTDANRLRCVEGLSSITRHRWTTKCSICHKTEGAVVRCSDCNREYHASCAWKAGHKFGFEIQPVKSSRRDSTIMVTFKGESGCMGPVVSCKEHQRSKRDMYGICETNEGGETALQVYCRAYKQAPVTQAHGLLRKARRLDPLLTTHARLESYGHHGHPSLSASTGANASTGDPECFRCHTHFSPMFYPAKGLGDDAFTCHSCHFLEQQQQQQQQEQHDTPMVVEVH
ncbi:Zinc finger protein 1 [Mycena chlorophos]|uniref:Zinc finger protein 1 n=1 Tax=Mycena chlorophos TaxID=658473 RepID=A0A8H6SZW3_MYCCL|nr:Zinc finger protein 1 [Mycena chlorophos]